MDTNTPTAKYKVGDLVHCWYTFYQFYYSYYEDFDTEPPIIGIIVDVDYAEYEDWPAETIYVVYCSDGLYRFFVEEEIVKLS